MSRFDETTRPVKLSLHTRIFLGFAVGAVLGLVANQLVASEALSSAGLEWLITNFTAPFGRIFLNLLFMVVVPIVFCSIALGVSQLGSGQKLGRVSTRTLGYFIVTSTISAALGLLLVQVVRPGDGFDPTDQTALLEQYRGEADEKRAMAEQQRFWPDVLVGIVSRNPLKDAVELNMIPIIAVTIDLWRIKGVA